MNRCVALSTDMPSPLDPPLPSDSSPFDRGDVMIRGLWDKQTSCILDVRVTNTDSPSYLGTTPEKHLAKQEKIKKRKYLEACLQQRRHFSPYVVDCFGLLGEEAIAVNQRLAAKLARKWNSSYSMTMGYVNARISVAIVRATHLCIRGSRVPFREATSKQSAWDDGSGLFLLDCAR